MNLATKHFVFYCCLLFAVIGNTQNDTDNKEKIESKPEAEESSKKTRQKLFAFSYDYYLPITAGNNFIGQGTKGKRGYNIKIQAYAYKQIFLGMAFGKSHLKVNDINITGNYQSSEITNQYVYLGYEFLPLEKIRIGLSLGFLGDAIYKNSAESSGQVSVIHFKDTGKITNYEAYLDYEVKDFFSIYFNYSYRTDKMDIRAPSEFQSFFSKGNYHNIGIGFKFYVGKSSLFKN